MSVTWSYGVTTVSGRVGPGGLFEKTLTSLRKAGFNEPEVFLDLNPKLRAFGNWMRAAWGLYVLNPTADRYAIFQDDLVTYRNLREYLDTQEFPMRGYWNLYTYQHNERKVAGWNLADQMGKGAVGLVFNNQGMRLLLSQYHMVERVQDPKRGHLAIDGAVVDGMRKCGFQEWTHSPSLLQHTGIESAIGNSVHELAPSFRGEEFDAMELIKELPVRRVPRIGLVGWNCDNEFGKAAWQLANILPVEKWLVATHPLMATKEPHPDVETVVCPRGGYGKLCEFVRDCDLVVFYKKPPFHELLNAAVEERRRIVMITNDPVGAATYEFPTVHVKDLTDGTTLLDELIGAMV